MSAIRRRSSPRLESVNNLKKGIRPYQEEATGAGNGVRTRDPKLGKLVLYQLSYARSRISLRHGRLPAFLKNQRSTGAVKRQLQS